MMNELLVLSLLLHWPLHAYKLAKIANNIIGPEEEISRGTLSSLLTRLEQAGLIAPADMGTLSLPLDRPSRVLEITPQGRERFSELMMDTTSHMGPYSKLFHVKALNLECLPLVEQLVLAEHYLAYCQQRLHAKQAQAQAFADSLIKQEQLPASFRQAAVDLMHYKIAQWQSELAWAQSLREQVASRLRQQHV